MNKLTNFVIIATMIIATSSNTTAQDRKEKIESAKVAFISSRLNLDAQTAEKFWPMFNQYTAENKAANAERKAFVDILENTNSSDKDIERALAGILATQQKNVDIAKRYQAEFLRVLTPRQLAVLYKLERDFKEKLLERVSQGRGQEGRRDAPPPPPRRRMR